MPLASFAGSPWANTRASFETEPFEIHIFRPRSTHESPSRFAVVRSFVASLPTSGSVRPKHPMTSPLQSAGSQRCFCSSVPNLRMVISTSEIWTESVVRTDESARPTSSVTSACETKSRPMPPYFSGTGPPSRPSGAILRSTSFGKVSPRSRSRAPGAISLSAKSFASLRMDCCSGVRSKSKPRVYGVPMFDDRRRPLREDERARAMRSAPILGGLDAATYALDLDVAGNRRDLVIRLFTLSEHRDGNAARRYWKAIDAIPATAPVPVPRPVLLDAEGVLVGVPCMVMTRLDGVPLARPADEDSWIDQLAGALASIHGIGVRSLPPDYARGPTPADGMESHLIRFEPKTPDGLWLEVAQALRSAATGVTANTPVLTHHDFWFGNTLWSDERLTGVVDWDEARIDDPAFDVAYARLDMQLTLAGDA